MNLDEIESSQIDDRVKGMPGGVRPFALRDIGQMGWNVLRGDLPLPLAVLKRESLEHNSRWMRAFLELTGARIAPHGKTTMSPQLYQLQLDDGAWGITLATVGQVQVARRFGLNRILLANQLVGQPAIDYIAHEIRRDPQFEFWCLVDSVRGVQLLADGWRRQKVGKPLAVLLEMGLEGQRCGCRSVQAALDVAHEIKRAAGTLELRGVEGFEGLVSGDSMEQKEQQVRRFMKLLVETAERCSEQDLLAGQSIMLSAGGSAFYDLVVQELGGAQVGQPAEIIIRSGCYLTHDTGMYEQLQQRLLARSPQAQTLGAPLQPALELWAYVQSRPEPQRIVLTLGKRDCSFDVSLPVVTHWYRPEEHARPTQLQSNHKMVRLNDQHAMLDVPADSPLRVGDMVACGISHPCTTFDRWQLIPVVDQQYNVVSGIRTFF